MQSGLHTVLPLCRPLLPCHPDRFCNTDVPLRLWVRQIVLKLSVRMAYFCCSPESQPCTRLYPAGRYIREYTHLQDYSFSGCLSAQQSRCCPSALRSAPPAQVRRPVRWLLHHTDRGRLDHTGRWRHRQLQPEREHGRLTGRKYCRSNGWKCGRTCRKAHQERI